ncbi:MAG TPA: glycine betaine ABC transporter substrate-binding protein [Pseudomonas sp.]|nr:glycine betaine ABC transporter substrate-binding protein [Pseudomonas sp.]
MFKQFLGAAALALGLSTTAQAADKPTLSFGYVNGWDESVAAAHVVAEVLQSKLDYPVQLKAVDAAIMWQGVARGDLDATLSAWLPATHGEYYNRLKDKVELVNINYRGARIGLVVPDYVEARTIADLNNLKKELRGQITGIDAGAGVMRRTEDAIKDYDLDLKLMPSSGAAMTVALARAVQAEKPIVVTGWVPHWKFAKWNLRFLEDPKGTFGAAEEVHTAINPGLHSKAPEAAAFLKKFAWGDQEVGAVMLDIREGTKPADAARAWVEKNPEKVAQWL